MVAGNIADLAIAKQSAKGSAAAAAAYRFYLTNGGLAPNRQVQDLAETTGARLRSRSFVSLVSGEGTPEIAGRVEPLGLLLSAALGSVSTTGAADPYSHEITPGTLPYLTIWRMLADLVYEKFVDCKLGQLVLTSEAGQPLKIGFTVMALDPRSETTHSQSGVAIVDSDPLMHYDGAGAFQVENTAISEIDRIVCTINNNAAILQGDAVHGFSASEALLDITLEVGHVIVDAALYNRFHYGAASPSNDTPAVSQVLELGGSPAGIDFKWTRVAASPGPERSLELAATRLQLQSLGGWEPNTDGTPLKQTATYKIYDPGGGNPGLTATLVNGEDGSSY